MRPVMRNYPLVRRKMDLVRLLDGRHGVAAAIGDGFVCMRPVGRVGYSRLGNTLAIKDQILYSPFRFNAQQKYSTFLYESILLTNIEQFSGGSCCSVIC